MDKPINNYEKIRDYLGEEASYFLDHASQTIPKSQIHLL